MLEVRPLRRMRALSLRLKPRASIADCTRSMVSGVTPGSPLTTRETVFRPTPARAATSFIVGRAPYRFAAVRGLRTVSATDVRPPSGSWTYVSGHGHVETTDWTTL